MKFSHNILWYSNDICGNLFRFHFALTKRFLTASDLHNNLCKLYDDAVIANTAAIEAFKLDLISSNFSVFETNSKDAITDLEYFTDEAQIFLYGEVKRSFSKPEKFIPLRGGLAEDLVDSIIKAHKYWNAEESRSKKEILEEIEKLRMKFCDEID